MRTNRLWHAPTVLLIVGYPVFWLELYLFRKPQAQCSWLAWILFGCWLGFALARDGKMLRGIVRAVWQDVISLPVPERVFWLTAIAWAGALLTIAAWSAVLPLHLVQEYDTMYYYYAMMRQHLARHSFAMVPWSVFDLRLLPLQAALSPFWFASRLPNKFPQFIFFIGLLLMIARWVYRLGGRNGWRNSCLVCFTVLGSHGFGIQLGTAMFDIAIAYLFLAALDSALEGQALWAGIEFAFYALSKAFMPLLCASLVVAGGMMWFAHRRGWLHMEPPFVLNRKSFHVVSFLIAFILIGSPFFFKSIEHTGSPLYPFFAGFFKPRFAHSEPVRQAILASASQQLGAHSSYGDARSWPTIATWWWWVAVPEIGVNNRFDYPLGLPWLLFLVPFLIVLIFGLRHRRISLPIFLAVCYIFFWWQGSEEVRYLYLPLILMVAGVVTAVSIDRSTTLIIALNIALVATLLSVYRSNRASLGKRPWEVLRSTDQELVLMSQRVGPTSSEGVDIQQGAVAFAGFPVRSVGGDYLFWKLPKEVVSSDRNPL